MIQRLRKAYNDVLEGAPLIHCITNPISINQCANVILAIGARPIMAQHPKEAGEITSTADALLLNLGNITDVRIKSMKISARAAYKKNIPFVIDCVGVACSKIRRKIALKIVAKYKPAIIKGNYSEIYAMYKSGYKSAGVDSDKGLDAGVILKAAKEIAVKYECVILASGKTDIITDGKKTYLMNNGCKQLSHITGTGCMLGALATSYLSKTEPIYAAVLACAMLSIAGEKGEKANKNGSFMTELMDNISSFDINGLEDEIKLEEKQ